MIVVILAPPLIAGAWLGIKYWNESRQPKYSQPACVW